MYMWTRIFTPLRKELTELSFGSSYLCPGKLAFARNSLVRFVGALDAIFRLATAAWKLFDHLENAARHIPTDCRPDGNKNDRASWHRV
jgi:hypothetical protein